MARFLGVSPKTVRKWQLGGSLPFVKLGGKLVRFEPEAIRAWVDERAARCRRAEEPALVVDLRRRLAR
ncbi:MAG: helix-turn-helix domain-containing protein [Actinomycetota bacterium]